MAVEISTDYELLLGKTGYQAHNPFLEGVSLAYSKLIASREIDIDDYELELWMKYLNYLDFNFWVCYFFRNEMIKASKVDFRADSNSYTSSLWLFPVLWNDCHGRSVEKIVLSDFLETENVCLNFSKNLKSWAFYWRNIPAKEVQKIFRRSWIRF